MSQYRALFTLRLSCLLVILLHACTAPTLLKHVPNLHESCQIYPTTFRGWNAQELSNRWVTLIIVPQLGGRLMQVSLNGHPYLFINPRYEGKYFSPSEVAPGRWVNYGGDKIWPLPEGTQDEQHWPGPVSDALDDGTYDFAVVSQSPNCTVRLEGPPDARTGLQYSREITLNAHFPEIFFHAVMKNIARRPIEWSMQSVTQYDTSKGDGHDRSKEFWAFTPVNPRSKYIDGYYVRSGLSHSPSYTVKDGLFTLNWSYLESEVWIDSAAGWLAILGLQSQYAMVERFTHQTGASYPGAATVIFYSNGPGIEIDSDGLPNLGPTDPSENPYYMEAEINSPLVHLDPGDTFALDTRWYPTRASGVKSVTDAGLIARELTVTAVGAEARFAGSFGVFFPGKLVLRSFNELGRQVAEDVLQSVSPTDVVELHAQVRVSPTATRVSLHLIDELGADRGMLGQVQTRFRKDREARIK